MVNNEAIRKLKYGSIDELKNNSALPASVHSNFLRSRQTFTTLSRIIDRLQDSVKNAHSKGDVESAYKSLFHLSEIGDLAKKHPMLGVTIRNFESPDSRRLKEVLTNCTVEMENLENTLSEMYIREELLKTIANNKLRKDSSPQPANGPASRIETPNDVVSEATVHTSPCLNVIKGRKETCDSDDIEVPPGVLQVLSTVATCTISEYVQSRLVTKIVCPIDGCSRELTEWLCATCHSQVKFSVEGLCVCKCGQYPLQGTEVRCNSLNHVFRERVASSVADDFYNVAVFSSDEALSKKFIDVVTGGSGVVRNKQQVINLFDMEKHIGQVRKIHLVCIVIPQRSENDDEEHLGSLIRSKLIEVKFLVGQQSLQNVIVCSEEELLEELCLDADNQEFRVLELSEDLIIPTYRYGSSEDAGRLVRIVCDRKPVMNLEATCRGSSDKMAVVAKNLAHICGILSCAIEFKLKKKNAVVNTHFTGDSKSIHQLALLDVVNLEENKNRAWRSDVLLIDSEVVDSESVLKRELADLQDYKKRLMNKVLSASSVVEQRRELASICAYLAEGRYCQEIAEFLNVVGDARTQSADDSTC